MLVCRVSEIGSLIELQLTQQNNKSETTVRSKHMRKDEIFKKLQDALNEHHELSANSQLARAKRDDTGRLLQTVGLEIVVIDCGVTDWS